MASSAIRPRVFLDVHVAEEPAGRLVVELFADKAPKTCENFRALCTGSNPTLTYKMSPIHRIIDEFMIQGGDITKGDGTGGDSIYGGEFDDENIGWREIDTAGLVCMANRGKNTNSSQFFITLAPCPHLNAKHTAFGHVVSGQAVLDRLAALPVDKNDRPTKPVLIANCGELERRKKAPTAATLAVRLPIPLSIDLRRTHAALGIATPPSAQKISPVQLNLSVAVAVALPSPTTGERPPPQ
ncbi:hypothetical protein W97_05274 [Coniosporium apollinis CBS 100218]|uniref:Peptidyl-prolyl cis-trans isomerase n=1 Tax=Coniosporium apollinis (strain CBS 100218) TaxID=1168221 RepID=R7YWJ2_CONA1|nr:uncharacterized protein W97_05274 [Coniosporium apollinis CBS 100218]EON66031.1 hypothetical protein W97_05274 [Coniosporium apollinis CBS 100218]